jgi:hypothetical protein
LEIAALAFILVTVVVEGVSVTEEYARTGECQVAVNVEIDAEVPFSTADTSASGSF